MTSQSSRHTVGSVTHAGQVQHARTLPSSAAVMNIVVRVAGIVEARLDLAHIGTAEQQLGLSFGTVLVYLTLGNCSRRAKYPQVA
jgi:hypothetical protein